MNLRVGGEKMGIFRNSRDTIYEENVYLCRLKL